MNNTTHWDNPLIDQRIIDVNSLHGWISRHPSFSQLPQRVLGIILHSFGVAEDIHKHDLRKDKNLYILHPIRLVTSMIQKYPDIVHPDDSIVLILHDSIEDHPECWPEILRNFGLSIFRDILILSKISASYRKDMLEWFVKNYDPNDLDVGNILQILSPVIPVIKLKKFSRYTENIHGIYAIRLKNAMTLYRVGITSRDQQKPEALDEYISLGNYLYFHPKDCRRKLQDMIDNMADMENMEVIKPGYIEKRRIKAYILGVKLRNFNMMDEYTQLDNAFQNT